MSLHRIAIPSYKREHTIGSKTLMMLLREGFDLDMVDVFVADQEEYDKYRKVLGPDMSIVVGVPGIHRQRQFIQEYYPADVWVLSCDDDLRGIRSIYHDGVCKVSDIIPDMIRVAEREGSGLVGIYPMDDARCLDDRAVKGFTFIIGSFYLFKNNFRYFSYPDQTTEDFTRCARYFLERGPLLRFEGWGVRTSYAKEAGGLSDVRSEDGRQKAEMQRLVESYPTLYALRERHGKPVDVRIILKKRETIWKPFRD